ncbi:FKBP-type peptidyl-prolyl cis-trans isomerase [bacterium]|nr:FKBP-type peptidyl-prolyl cis-trans isomerase [bacterium]
MRRAAALIAVLTLALAGCREGAQDREQPAAAPEPEPPAAQVEPPAGDLAGQAIAKLTEGEGAGKAVLSAASGLQVLDLLVGTGAQPQPGQTCSTHATLWLLDGTKIWSSLDDGTPFDFTLAGGQVIRGWDEGVAGMKAGGKRRLAVPPDLGYGAKGRPPVPPDAWLIFEIELLAVK